MTIQSFSTQTVKVSFDVSAAGDKFTYRDTGGALTAKDFTMTIGQTIVTPSNGFNDINPVFGTCNCVIVDVPVSLTAGQQTVISGSLALSGASDPTSLPSYSIAWFTSSA